MIGVRDRFGISGKPWELVQTFGLTAEHIAERVLDLLDRKRQRLHVVMEGEDMFQCVRCHTAMPASALAIDPSLPSAELCVCPECRAMTVQA